MNVGILTIGNELISGRTQDTNASLIARTLQVQGWPVVVILSVGDDEAAIRTALELILSQADAAIVTGGLGPTADDITTAAIARIFSLPLVTDEAVLAYIKSIFEKYRLNWTDNNAKQAVFPAGAEVIPNPAGTAAGFALRKGRQVVAVIPGVPREVARMLPEGIVPLLRRAFPEAAACVATRTVRSFGLGEAEVDQALADADWTAMGVEIGFYPHFPENHIVLTARAATDAEAERRLQEAEAAVTGRLGRHVFSRNGEALEVVVGRLLRERGLTLAVAESCTGGLITDRLTDVPGSSAYLERGLVTYSNAAKVALLGVPEAVLAAHGAVSEETARRMAVGVRRQAGTDLGLAVTGIAGPEGGTAAKPVGTVYIALADADETVCRPFAFRWDRRRIKMIAAQSALMMVKRYLAGEVQQA